MQTVRPVVLLIGGHDPSGGAGVIADALVAGAGKTHPVSVVSALTEQDTRGCHAVHPVARDVFALTLARVLEDFGEHIAAIKIGMLGSLENAATVRDALARLTVPSVLDPIFHPTLGVPLLDDGGAAATRALLELCEVVALVTPNVAELAQLTRQRVTDEATLRSAARALAQRGASVLAKGGHLATAEAIDILVRMRADAEVAELVFERLARPRVAGDAPHGTGCALSTSIAVHLAHGSSLHVAVSHAVAEVHARIAAPFVIGRGRPLLAPV